MIIGHMDSRIIVAEMSPFSPWPKIIDDGKIRLSLPDSDAFSEFLKWMGDCQPVFVRNAYNTIISTELGPIPFFETSVHVEIPKMVVDAVESLKPARVLAQCNAVANFLANQKIQTHDEVSHTNTPSPVDTDNIKKNFTPCKLVTSKSVLENIKKHFTPCKLVTSKAVLELARKIAENRRDLLVGQNCDKVAEFYTVLPTIIPVDGKVSMGLGVGIMAYVEYGQVGFKNTTNKMEADSHGKPCTCGKGKIRRSDVCGQFVIWVCSANDCSKQHVERFNELDDNGWKWLRSHYDTEK